MSSAYRTLIRILTATAAAFAITAAAPSMPFWPADLGTASAQDTDVITMDFVGFGAGGDFYAIVQASKLSGKSLVVYKIGGQGPALVIPLEGTSVSKALKSKQVASFGIRTSGFETGMKAPAGYQLGGAVVGESLQLTLSSGAESMTLGYVPIFSNPNRTKAAQISIKNAFWSPDSKRVVIILNQKLDGDWPVNTDMVAAYTLG